MSWILAGKQQGAGEQSRAGGVSEQGCGAGAGAVQGGTGVSRAQHLGPLPVGGPQKEPKACCPFSLWSFSEHTPPGGGLSAPAALA